jgi:hypothetical protein
MILFILVSSVRRYVRQDDYPLELWEDLLGDWVASGLDRGALEIYQTDAGLAPVCAVLRLDAHSAGVDHGAAGGRQTLYGSTEVSIMIKIQRLLNDYRIHLQIRVTHLVAGR